MSLCMIPGPIEIASDVAAMMGSNAMSHIDPQFIEEFGDSISMMRSFFDAADNSQPFLVSGSGVLGWDMIGCNLLNEDSNVLVCNTGTFGTRFGDCLECFGAKVTHLHGEKIGIPPTAAQLRNAIKKMNYRLVTFTHVDTSTSVKTDIQTLAKIIHENSPDTLIIVDAVCSAGGEEIKMSDWGLDVVLTASQKALGAPPGLCVVVAGPRALSQANAKNGYYLDWKRWIPIMNAYEQKKPSYFATPPVQTIRAFYCAMKSLCESKEKRILDHKATAAHVRNTLQSFGLKIVACDGHCANTLTAAYCPVDQKTFLQSVASQGIVIAGGLHSEIGSKTFRIGHMGISALQTNGKVSLNIEKTLSAIKVALVQSGFLK